MVPHTRTYARIIYERKKADSQENITWSELRKQNLQAKKIYFHEKINKVIDQQSNGNLNDFLVKFENRLLYKASFACKQSLLEY